MKILCYLNHFYGKSLYFEGKSSTQESSVRKEIIEKCIAQLANIKGVEIKICGIEGHSLVKPDIDFSNIKNNPTLLIYESLNHMVNFLDSYDYFINIEDDIYLPEETFNNVVEFDKTAFLNEVLHPNRHETDDNGNKYCVDILALDSWTFQRRRYHGIELRVALNPHSEY